MFSSRLESSQWRACLKMKTGFFPFFLFVGVVSSQTLTTANVAELLEKIETQEALLQQQAKLAQRLTEVENRIRTVQEFQINRVGPLQQKIYEAEEKISRFIILPELVTDLETQMKTIVQLQEDNLASAQMKLDEAYKKLNVCSNIDDALKGMEGCVSKVTEVQVRKISSLEAKLQKIESQQVKLSNLPDLVEVYKNSQDALNKLHVATVQVNLKKAEQKLDGYSGLPEQIRQLENRVKTLETGSGNKDLADKHIQLQKDVTSLRQTQQDFKSQIDGGKKSVSDLKDKHLHLSKKMESLEQGHKGLQDQMHQSQTISELEKKLNDATGRLQKEVTSLQNARKNFEKEVLNFKVQGARIGALEKSNAAISDETQSLKATVQMLMLNDSLQVGNITYVSYILNMTQAQIGKDFTSLREADKKLEERLQKQETQIKTGDTKKSVSDLKDQQLQLGKKVELLEQGHKGLQSQIHQSQTISEMKKKLDDATGRLQKDVTSLQKADKNLEKEVLNFKAQGARIAALERSNAAMADETQSLNAIVQMLMFNDSLQVGNITYVSFILNMTQVQIGIDITSLKEADKKLEERLQKQETQLKSHQDDLRNNANKFKLIEGTILRHAGLIKMSGQNTDAAGRFANLESDSLVGKKERAILYDTIKLIKEDMRREQGQTKSQNERQSSLSAQYLNLSVALKDLRAQVKFFHSEFSIDNIVDATKRRTTLHVAAMEGNVEQVAYLLRNGADAEVEDYKKWRPLHLAAWQGHVDAVRELLASGAKVNPIDEYGYTPLHWAAQYGREACVILLLETGANLEARDKSDETPLHKAAWYEQTKMVELLLKRGARVNAYRKEHYTALHLAAQKGYLACVKALVNKGADVHAMTIDGFTALDLALSHKHQNVINYLNMHT